MQNKVLVNNHRIVSTVVLRKFKIIQEKINLKWKNHSVIRERERMKKKCNQGWKEEVLILETSRRRHNVSVSSCHIQWERLDGKMNFLDKVPYGLIKMLVVLWCGVCVMRKNVLSLLYQGTNKRHDNAI